MHSTTLWWPVAYVAAVSETDHSKIFRRVADALIAIEAQLDANLRIGVSERLSIEAARQELRTMEAKLVTKAILRTTRVSERLDSRLVH
jgi:hypothetical protein